MAVYCWVDGLKFTCGLTACTLGSAPGPTLGNKYGKTSDTETDSQIHRSHSDKIYSDADWFCRL